MDESGKGHSGTGLAARDLLPGLSQLGGKTEIMGVDFVDNIALNPKSDMGGMALYATLSRSNGDYNSLVLHDTTITETAPSAATTARAIALYASDILIVNVTVRICAWRYVHALPARATFTTVRTHITHTQHTHTHTQLHTHTRSLTHSHTHTHTHTLTLTHPTHTAPLPHSHTHTLHTHTHTHTHNCACVRRRMHSQVDVSYQFLKFREEGSVVVVGCPSIRRSVCA